MKRLTILLFMLGLTLSFVMPVLAQVQNQKITVNTSDLTVDQLAKINAQAEIEALQMKSKAEIDALQKRLETYGNWVGIGGEIGMAVKESLNAVVEVSDKFSKTDVGMFTMVMVGWKIIGDDLTKILIGLLFFITFTTTLIIIFRRLTMDRRICIESNGWKFWLPKKYEVVKSKLDDEGLVWFTVIFIIAFLINIWVTYGIMF